MLRLCLRDLIVNKTIWLIAFPFYLMYGAIFFQTNIGFLVVHVLFALGMAISMLVIEEMNRTDRLFCSLPLKRSTIVLARYLSSFLVGLVGLVLFLSYGSLLNVLISNAKIDFDSFMTLAGIVAFLVLLTMVYSFFFPFYFRFGITKGAVFFSAFTFCLFLLFLGLLHLVASLDILPVNQSQIYSTEYWRAPGIILIFAINYAFQYLSMPVFLSLLLLVLAGLVFVSTKLSIKFYLKREF